MAQQKYILQGLDKSVAFLKEIIDLLKDADFTDIWFLSAYLKENAIYNLTSSIKKSGANIHFLVGVGNGVTSYQALKALLDLGVEVYTFDTARIGSIFHVKEILAYGDSCAKMVCGSANITPGGLANNIEAGVIVTLNLTDNQDRNFFDDAITAIQNLITMYPDHIKRQTINGVDDLLASGRIEDERVVSSTYKKRATSNHSITSVPFPLKAISLKAPKKATMRDKVRTVLHEENGIVSTAEFEQVWQSRPLKKSNIGITDNPNTNPKGEMGFGKGSWKENFDPKVYFRRSVFDALAWSVNELGDEVAEGLFSIHICGTDHGVYELTILHKRKGMEAENQNNYLTSIRWGNASSIIKNRNLIDRTLKLYKASDGIHFLIDIE